MNQPLTTLNINQLPDEFFIDLAVGVNTFADICDTYGIPPETAAALDLDPAFNRRLRIAKQVVEDDGTAFKSRCRVAVTESVGHIVNMLRDTDVPASTQLDAFKTLVKYGELEPNPKDTQQSHGPQLVLNIMAPDGTAHNFLEGEVVSPEPDPPTPAYSKAAPRLNIVPPQAAQLFGAD